MTDTEEQLIKQLAKDISDEIDREIINKIIKEAGNGFDWFFDDIEWKEL
jgi:hypothetical protein